MIAILEDKKGFRKQIEIYRMVPNIRIPLMPQIKVFPGNEESTMGLLTQELMFQYYGTEVVFGESVLLYREV